MSPRSTRGDVPESYSQRRRIAALAALVAAGALCVALARSQGHWYLAFVAFIPLFASIRFLAPTAAMAAGAFWGLCVFVFLALFGDIPTSHALTHLGALAAIPALYACIGARLTRYVGFSPYLLAVGWMGVELALLALGLRNGLLAAVLGDGPVIHWVGSFAWAALVTFLVTYVSAGLFAVVTRVCVGAGRRHYVPGSLNAPRRPLPQESFNVLFHFIRPAQPRAPPLAFR